ncbi:hypothetical protein E8E13_001207 [Curvularia kusanoi]|uniref:Uncharacterized protein n=1 Tax=Curvularia kusanoi TaxID=90978 RepID=A0A9P4T3I1_CURKU|nr:hypothetical protein E8E13_001207 [Curvularia kusanoi]
MANSNQHLPPLSTPTSFISAITPTQFQMQQDLLTALDAQVQALNTQMEALNVRLHNLSIRVDTMGTQHQSASVALASTAVQVAQLQTATAALAAQITQLEQAAGAATGAQPAPPPQQDLLSRIQALEQRDARLTARRKEALKELFNLRTLNAEAANAFQQRAAKLEEDDFEGMIIAWATSVSTTHNQTQFSVANMRNQLQEVVRGNPTARGPPEGFAYPPHYQLAGHCHAHKWPYPCKFCGD